MSDGKEDGKVVDIFTHRPVPAEESDWWQSGESCEGCPNDKGCEDIRTRMENSGLGYTEAYDEAGRKALIIHIPAEFVRDYDSITTILK